MRCSRPEQTEIVIESTGQRFGGIEGGRRYNQMHFSAFPDLQLTVTRLVADEQSAAVGFTFQGTHTGTFAAPTGDIPPTGRAVNVPCADFYEFENGKVTQLHTYSDGLTVLQQLGLLPQTPQPQAVPMQAQAQAQAQPHM